MPVDVYKVTRLNPLPEKLVPALCAYDRVYAVEDAIASGSLGAHLGLALQRKDYAGRYRNRGLPPVGSTMRRCRSCKRCTGSTGTA